MDNAKDTNGNGCTGGWGGHCRHDLYIWFQNKVGEACQTNWLFNNARVQRGNHGKNKDDAFDGAGWDYFNWNQVGCVSGYGFNVPNKVGLNNIYKSFDKGGICNNAINGKLIFVVSVLFMINYFNYFYPMIYGYIALPPSLSKAQGK